MQLIVKLKNGILVSKKVVKTYFFLYQQYFICSVTV